MRGTGPESTMTCVSSDESVPIAFFPRVTGGLRRLVSAMPIDFGRLVGHRRLLFRVSRFLRLPHEIRHQLLALVQKLLAGPASVLRPDRVFAEQRKRDRRIAVGHDG